jgi:hypothetical protein
MLRDYTVQASCAEKTREVGFRRSFGGQPADRTSSARAGNFELRQGEIDFCLFARKSGGVGACGFLRLLRGGKIGARGTDVYFIGCEGRIGEHRDFIGQRLNEAFTRRYLEPPSGPIFDDVGAQNARFEGGQERRVRGQEAFLTLGRHHDDELRGPIELYGNGRNEAERNRVGHRLNRDAHLLSVGFHFVDAAGHVKRLLGQMIEFAIENFGERRDRVFDLHVFAFASGELFGDEEGLRK